MSDSRRADEQVHEDVAALVSLFKGDPRTGTPGLVATLNTMAQRMDALSKSFDAYRESTERRLEALERWQRSGGGQVQMSPRIASMLVAMSVILITLMFWLIVRLGGA